MTEKLKLKNEQRIGRMTFFVAWVVIGVIGFFLGQFLFALLTQNYIDLISQILLWNIVLAIIGFIHHAVSGYLQSIAIYRFWGVKIRRWWWMTALGFAVSSFILNNFLSDVTAPLFSPESEPLAILVASVWLNIIALSLPTMAQAWLLKPYFKHVKLYVIAVVGMGILLDWVHFAFLQFGLVTLILHSAIISLSLLWLDHITYENGTIEL